MYNRVFSWLRIASFKHQNFYTVILTTWRQHLSKMYSKCPVFLFSVKHHGKFPSRPGFVCGRAVGGVAKNAWGRGGQGWEP